MTESQVADINILWKKPNKIANLFVSAVECRRNEFHRKGTIEASEIAQIIPK